MNLVVKRNQTELKGKIKRTDPQSVEVPPYLPDTAVVRADIARKYDNISFAETQVKGGIERLREQGVLDNTILIVTTDHGDGLPRMERSVFDSGLKVPLMIRFSGSDAMNSIDEQFISFVDLAPTILGMAGVNIPEHMNGRDIFSQTPKRQYVFAAADRHDNVQGRYRAIRDNQYNYIRNGMPDKPFFV